MIWRNPGSELDQQGNAIVKKFNNIGKVVIFGCGLIGKDIAPILQEYDLLDGFIDNDIMKQKEGWNGYNVWALESYLRDYDRKYIIVATNEINSEEICEQLVKHNLKEGIDFERVRHFMRYTLPILSFYKFGKVTILY